MRLWVLNALLALLIGALAWFIYKEKHRETALEYVPKGALSIWEYQLVNPGSWEDKSLLLPLKEVQKLYSLENYTMTLSKHAISKSQNAYLLYLPQSMSNSILKDKKYAKRTYKGITITEVSGKDENRIGAFFVQNQFLIFSSFPSLLEECIDQLGSRKTYSWQMESDLPNIKLLQNEEEYIFQSSGLHYLKKKNEERSFPYLIPEADAFSSSNLAFVAPDSLGILLSCDFSPLKAILFAVYSTFLMEGKPVVAVQAKNSLAFERLLRKASSESARLQKLGPEIAGLGQIHVRNFLVELFGSEMPTMQNTYFKKQGDCFLFTESAEALLGLKTLPLNRRKLVEKLFWEELGSFVLKMEGNPYSRIQLNPVEELRFQGKEWQLEKVLDVRAKEVYPLNDSLLFATGDGIYSVIHAQKREIVFQKSSDIQTIKELFQVDFLNSENAQWLINTGRSVHLLVANITSQLAERVLLEHPKRIINLLHSKTGLVIVDEGGEVYQYNKETFEWEKVKLLSPVSRPMKSWIQVKSGVAHLFIQSFTGELYAYFLQNGALVNGFPKKLVNRPLSHVSFTENSLFLLDVGGAIHRYQLFPWKEFNRIQLEREANFIGFNFIENGSGLVVARNTESVRLFEPSGTLKMRIQRQFGQNLDIQWFEYRQNNAFLAIFDSRNAYLYNLNGELLGGPWEAMPLVQLVLNEKSIYAYVASAAGLKIYRLHAV